MAMEDSSENSSGAARQAGRSLYDGTLNVLMTGIAIIIPLIITLYILTIALDFVSAALVPFIELLRWIGLIEWFRSTDAILLLIDLNVYRYVIDFLTELIAIAVLLGIVVIVGSVGRHRYGEQAIGIVDLAIASIPGIGTVYKSFRRMGDVMLDNEAENFQEIKLVECFGEDMYVIGFETSESPNTISENTGHDEMITLFVPLAPNPVTGGFLTHVPRSQVYDIDMSIEEGVRSILTSGVASGERADGTVSMTMGDLEKVTDIDRLQNAITTTSEKEDGTQAEEHPQSTAERRHS
jgi:uncharacterized membrane protein